MPTDPACIFCKIVAGDIPCHKLWEDDRALAFLDVGPLSEGHALIIPKQHYETLDQLPAEDAAAIGAALPALARAILEATGSTAYNIIQNNGAPAGQEVPHVHFHLIPRKPGTDRKDAVPGNGLPSGGWPAEEVDHELASDLVNSIRRHLQG
ncbi:HIT family protein [Phycisphaeraceae bacterium D3-23]